VIKRVAVIKLGVNSGTGDGGASSEIDMDRYSEAEEYFMVIAGTGGGTYSADTAIAVPLLKVVRLIM